MVGLTIGSQLTSGSALPLLDDLAVAILVAELYRSAYGVLRAFGSHTQSAGA